MRLRVVREEKAAASDHLLMPSVIYHALGGLIVVRVAVEVLGDEEGLGDILRDYALILAVDNFPVRGERRQGQGLLSDHVQVESILGVDRDGRRRAVLPLLLGFRLGCLLLLKAYRLLFLTEGHDAEWLLGALHMQRALLLTRWERWTGLTIRLAK